MKKVLPVAAALAIIFLIAGCAEDSKEEMSYRKVSPEEAKKLMETEKDYVVLDVRTEKEFLNDHLPDAILIPDYDIEQKAESLLTDKNQLIMVYCRSGNRSYKASQKLVDLGYTNIKDLGGIKEWPYETVGE